MGFMASWRKDQDGASRQRALERTVEKIRTDKLSAERDIEDRGLGLERDGGGGG